MNRLWAACLIAAFAVAAGEASKMSLKDDPNMAIIQKELEKYEAEGRHMTALGRAPAASRHDDPTPVIIAKEGYPVETHTVVTDDCYILEMHRIPFGKDSPPVAGEIRPVVFLQHGLLCSSADWVIAIPEKSLGFILADAGYDVWIGNYRGNTYSRSHCDLNPDRDNDYWHFTWQNMGRDDLPAMIDEVLLYTGASKIHYVGHSMGTTAWMVMMNERPEYADKFIMANLLAPVAYVDHMVSPIKYLAIFDDQIEWVAEHLGLGEFLPSNIFMDILADLFCDDGLFQGICNSVMFILCGFDPDQANETLIDTIVHHTPAGTSTFTVLHYAQEVGSGKFSKYDLDDLNNQYYGQDSVPEYSISAITPPVSLYWSQNDWLAAPADVLSLISDLPNLFDEYEVPFEKWNHLDFLYGIDADTLVYPQVLANMAAAQEQYGV